jgi:hypothetical protein
MSYTHHLTGYNLDWVGVLECVLELDANLTIGLWLFGKSSDSSYNTGPSIGR